MTQSFEATRTLLTHQRHALLARSGVVATGIGYKVKGGARTSELALVCCVERKRPLEALAARERIPASLDGVATDVWETGPFRALVSRTGRVRPAPGGVSLGHRDITAGTLGCLVRRRGERLILSNNHVLANSNAASPGDPILQPGPHDGGRLGADELASLEDFVPIRFAQIPSDCPWAGGAAAALNGLGGLVGSRTRLHAVRLETGENLVDAAVARPLRDEDVTPELLEIGRPTGLGRGELGLAVQKSGRTTGFTQGEILQVDVTVDVQYGPGQVARFRDQLMAGAMSQGGDSGSAVLDSERRVVGLLFAGSDSSTILNPIEHVLEALELELEL
jgi:hypothetical protein